MCEVVTKIFCSWFPVDDELALLDPVSDPIEAHIHRSGLSLFEGVVGDARGSGVIGFDWRWWLGMSESYKDSAESNCFLAVDKEATYFRFCCGGHGMVQFVADGMDGSIWRR